MKGRRLPDGDHDKPEVQPGDYWKSARSVFEACAPNGDIGRIKTHKVIEHEDGTITVSPSLIFPKPGDTTTNTGWHGWLERGIWRKA